MAKVKVQRKATGLRVTRIVNETCEYNFPHDEDVFEIEEAHLLSVCENANMMPQVASTATTKKVVDKTN